MAYGHRNWVWCWVQNMPGILFWRYLPEHLLANLFFLLYISAKGQPGPIFKAKLSALLGLPRALAKRRRIQAARTASIRQVHAAITRGFLTPYLQGYRRRKELRAYKTRIGIP